MTLEARLKKLRQGFAGAEIDGFLVSQPDNRCYLSGFTGSAGYLLITPRTKVLATDFRYLEQAGLQSPDYDVFHIKNVLADWFPELTARSDLKRLGFEASHVTFSLYHQLSDILKAAELPLKLIPVTGLIESLRVIKEPGEIKQITQAVKVSDSAFGYAETIIRPGMREEELAWEIEKFMRQEGSEDIPFDIVVASGANSARPHALPSAHRFETGEPVVIDIGARINGYVSDLTRTICLGAPDETFNRVYDAVLGAQLAAIEMIREGMSGGEADNIARIVTTEAGYGEAFGHGLGHGVGLSIHEAPRLGPNSTETLANGMVFTIEPGIYLPGWGGVRIEDTVVMEDGKIRVISQSGKVRA